MKAGTKKEYQEDEKMSRRKAIKKLTFTSLSIATMAILLNTQSSKAASNAPEAPTAPSAPGGGNPIWN